MMIGSSRRVAGSPATRASNGSAAATVIRTAKVRGATQHIHRYHRPPPPRAAFGVSRHSPHMAHANLPYTWQFAYVYMTICLHIHDWPFLCVCLQVRSQVRSRSNVSSSPLEYGGCLCGGLNVVRVPPWRPAAAACGNSSAHRRGWRGCRNAARWRWCQSHRERLESLEARDDAFGPQGGLMPPESVVWCLRKLKVNQWAVSEREARQAQLRASV